MAKKKREGKKYSYMDTYGDLVTLLLCFFVLLFAMSTVEEVKYNAFVEALTERFGPTPPQNMSFVTESASVSGSELGEEQPTGAAAMDPDQTLPADLSQLQEAISKFIQESGMEGEVMVEQSASGATFLRLSDNLLFDGDSSELRPLSREFLDFFAEALNSVEDQILQVQFNGHTASIAGSAVDDWILAAERAGQVSTYVSNTGEFNRFKIKSSFYGRNYPIADNGTPEGRAQNRRVDIIVLGNDASRLELTLVDALRIYFPTDDTQYFEGDPEDLPDNMINNIYPNAAADESGVGLTDEQIDALLDDLDSPDTPVSPEARDEIDAMLEDLDSPDTT